LEAAKRPRSYIHFDVPLGSKECEKLVADPDAVSKHSFYPFIRHDIVRKRIKRQPGGKLIKSTKIRDIRYAAHADAAIYSYYNYILTDLYEKEIIKRNLGANIIAFRALSRSNVDFAKEAFDWIDSNRPCTALGFDVTDFFGSLDHQLLKSAWAGLLGKQKLSSDHFAVFKSLTKHASVELIAARKKLGISREELGRRTRICDVADFRSQIRGSGLVFVNEKNKGIPQGSPISAALSNVYMIPFDEKVRGHVEAVGGFYRRYCDDILVIVPDEQINGAKLVVSQSLMALRLSMQSAKTLECAFGKTFSNKPLQYLGLVYDGVCVYIRSSGVARYYAKMRAGIKQHKFAKTLDGSTPILKQRRKHLLRQYTEHAPQSHRNYFSYIKLAQKHAKSASVRRQLRFHMKRFTQLIK
jgi:RNA-directed DNA polymerase